MSLRDLINRQANAGKKAKSPESKNPAKKVWVEQTPAYQRGWKDVDLMLRGGFSPYFAYMSVFRMGLGRKSQKDSDPDLYEYCEGCNDRLHKVFRGKVPTPCSGV